MTKLRYLKMKYRGTVSPVWPPRWSGSYGRGTVFPRGEEGILIRVERMPEGSGLWLTIRFNGLDFRGHLIWAGPPSVPDVERVLQWCVGHEIKALGDVEV